MLKSMRRALVLIFIVASSCLLWCAEALRSEGLISLANSAARIEIVDPDGHPDNWDNGCRFSGGAWIKDIVPKGSGRGALVSSSVFKDHPAFGLAEEFIPSVKLRDLEGKDSAHFKIGVGIVARHGENVFKDTPLEFFKWKVSLSAEDETPCALFSQEGASGSLSYSLLKTVKLEPDGLLRVSGVLRNTGASPLEGELYLHPFFPVKGSISSHWRAVSSLPPPELDEKAKLRLPLSKERPFHDEIAPSPIPPGSWLLVGCDGDSSLFGMRPEGADWTKTRFWMIDKAFAVEPFLPLSVKPGESFSWTWSVYIR